MAFLAGGCPATASRGRLAAGLAGAGLGAAVGLAAASLGAAGRLLALRGSALLRRTPGGVPTRPVAKKMTMSGADHDNPPGGDHF